MKTQEKQETSSTFIHEQARSAKRRYKGSGVAWARGGRWRWGPGARVGSGAGGWTPGSEAVPPPAPRSRPAPRPRPAARPAPLPHVFGPGPAPHQPGHAPSGRVQSAARRHGGRPGLRGSSHAWTSRKTAERPNELPQRPGRPAGGPIRGRRGQERRGSAGPGRRRRAGCWRWLLAAERRAAALSPGPRGRGREVVGWKPGPRAPAGRNPRPPRPLAPRAPRPGPARAGEGMRWGGGPAQVRGARPAPVPSLGLRGQQPQVPPP